MGGEQAGEAPWAGVSGGMNRLLLLIFLCLLPLAARGAAPEIVLEAPAVAPVELPAAAGPGTRTVEMPLPIAKVRGARLDFRAVIKAEDVATPPQVYNGIKFMLVTEGPSGKQYPAHDHLWGTFGWTPEHFRAVVPADATKATLVLGLEATTGRAWFRDVSVTVSARPFSGGPVAPAGRIYTGHPSTARLRGAMISPDVSAADLHVLGREWGANLVRWQLYWVTPDGRFDGWRDPVAYDAWLEGALKHLDALLPVCRREGLRVVVDLHSPPGGNILLPGYAWPLFQQKAYQDKFAQVWDKIARRYKGDKTVWGYDLANEPIEGDVADGLLDWHALATRTALAVHRIDPDHAIVVEPGPGGGYDQLPYFAPLPLPNVVYSVHLYEPAPFTMQGVTPDMPTGVSYPGIIKGVRWDRAEMARSLQVVADYQKHYHVAIYIGEFSAIRWAPGGDAWLRDAISIFEANNWDWSYHAFREWQGWSAEYGPDKNATAPSATPTDREKLLRSWYAKNVKPKPRA